MAVSSGQPGPFHKAIYSPFAMIHTRHMSIGRMSQSHPKLVTLSSPLVSLARSFFPCSGS